MSEAEAYALMKHNEVCKKFWHGKKCINAGMMDIAFYELIKGEMW